MSHIYVVGAYSHENDSKLRAVKVGIADDIVKRMYTLFTGNHLPCRVVQYWALESRAKARLLEQRAHAHFRDCRLSGEWFRPPVTPFIEFIQHELGEPGHPGGPKRHPYTNRVDVLCKALRQQEQRADELEALLMQRNQEITLLRQGVAA